MPLVTILISLLLAPIALVTGFFAIELLVGLRASRIRPKRESNPWVALVIPAHNEAKLIRATVTELLEEVSERSFVLVVADNCTDATAEEAQLGGAQVLIRADTERKGKGFALAAARDYLRNDAPEIVIVVDADSRLDSHSLRALAATAMEASRPVQAVYLFAPDAAAPPLVQLSNFAFMIKNLVRQRGLQRLAGRAHLTGTGMAFPWHLFQQSDLGGSNIVEDLAVGLELGERGVAPLLVEDARVWSVAASVDETLVQRSRWEGGYLQTAVRTAPRLLIRSLRRGDGPAMCAALDLSVPPLALLVLFNAATLALACLAWAIGGAFWPIIVQVTIGLLAFLALCLAWFREGRQFASGATLLRLPLYLVWKLPMYVRFARYGAPKEWVRTAR